MKKITLLIAVFMMALGIQLNAQVTPQVLETNEPIEYRDADTKVHKHKKAKRKKAQKQHLKAMRNVARADGKVTKREKRVMRKEKRKMKKRKAKRKKKRQHKLKAERPQRERRQ